MLLILVFSNLNQDLHYQTTTSLPPIVMSFDLGWIALSASLFSACRFVNNRAWGFPVSIVTLTNSYNKSPFLSFYLSIHPSILLVVLFLWRTLLMQGVTDLKEFVDVLTMISKMIRECQDLGERVILE